MRSEWHFRPCIGNSVPPAVKPAKVNWNSNTISWPGNIRNEFRTKVCFVVDPGNAGVRRLMASAGRHDDLMWNNVFWCRHTTSVRGCYCHTVIPCHNPNGLVPYDRNLTQCPIPDPMARGLTCSI